MGIWGSETFENDFAEDFLGDHVRLLKRGIEKYLKERHAEKALAAVAALRALAVGIPSASIKISAPDVRKWESQYFDCFDWYYSVGEGEEEEVLPFRQNAKKEFKALLRVCPPERAKKKTSARKKR